VVEALARSGIGELTLIDMDDVCITNTNRQLPALAHTIGVTKVDVLAARVAEINPACRVNRVIEFLTESNVDRLLAPNFDFVVDAVDRTSIKALIIAKCHARGLPSSPPAPPVADVIPPSSKSPISATLGPIRCSEACARACAATTASPKASSTVP
jgi:molybdopterin/thiamine biosynthesis adenylyltransferase